ncbi:sel1 repeat family protein [Alphaproteobacteria bacterium]|nr:sel1 repeat family protein [Alphaproteobacteria bacterium]
MKRLLTTLVILTGLIGSAGAVWADAQSDFDKGDAAYKAGNKVESVKWFRKSAEQGNAKAQRNLGWMYKKGNGVTKDYAEAVKWYRKAAEQGLAGAKASLGKMKSVLVTRRVDQCLFENIEKVTGPETKSIVEKHCYRKFEKKSLDWLLQNVD